MEKYVLSMIFENIEGEKVKVRINDVRPDITSAEVETLGNKIVEKDAILGKKLKLASYISAELEQTIVEIL